MPGPCMLNDVTSDTAGTSSLAATRGRIDSVELRRRERGFYDKSFSERGDTISGNRVP